MSPPVPLPSPVLYVWPGDWGLPSTDPECLAAVLHLQLALPEKVAYTACVDPDTSPSGQLPLLVHGAHTRSPLPAVAAYAATLAPDLDAPLSPAERAQSIAWAAHASTVLGDLVAHMFYALPSNWTRLTHPTLARVLPLPQRYYVPGRLRELYRPRLEAAGLWGQPDAEEPKPSAFSLRTEKNAAAEYQRAFEREKVIEKARTALNLYARLLGDKSFFFHNRPTSLDARVAAHILLLLDAPFPDPLLQTLVTTSYPTLAAHARAVRDRALPTLLHVAAPEAHSLHALFPRRVHVERTLTKDDLAARAEEAHFARLRWGFYALASTAIIGIGGMVLAQMQIRVERLPRMYTTQPPAPGLAEELDELEQEE